MLNVWEQHNQIIYMNIYSYLNSGTTPLDIWNGKQCVKNICIFETIISSLVHAEFIIYIEHGEDLSEPEEWQQPTLFKTQLSGFILPMAHFVGIELFYVYPLEYILSWHVN